MYIYIRSKSAYNDKLLVRIDKDTVEYLPTWYQYKSDEEIDRAKARIRARYKSNCDCNCDNIEVSSGYDWGVLIPQLRREGLTSSEIREVQARVRSGRTLNSAIQDIENRWRA